MIRCHEHKYKNHKSVFHIHKTEIIPEGIKTLKDYSLIFSKPTEELHSDSPFTFTKMHTWGDDACNTCEYRFLCATNE